MRNNRKEKKNTKNSKKMLKQIHMPHEHVKGNMIILTGHSNAKLNIQAEMHNTLLLQSIYRAIYIVAM